MSINVGTKSFRPRKVGSNNIEKVSEFDYLGIHLENRNTWNSQITKSEMILKHRAASILRFANCKTYRPTSPIIEIWKAQAVAGASYGSEIWGHVQCDKIQIAEN